jgi:hypothetical protein
VASSKRRLLLFAQRITEFPRRPLFGSSVNRRDNPPLALGTSFWLASPEGAPKVLVVSAGAVEANKEMGLDSPVLLDQQFATGRAFGAGGTPSAVLIDEAGKIASEVAVGAPAVLELAGAGRTRS